MKVVDLVILDTLIFEICSQNPTTIEMKVVELVILNTFIFWSTSVNFLKFVHKILLKLKIEVVELVILNTLIFLIHLGQLFEVCSQNHTIDFKSVPRGSEPWHLINLNILKFVHKILLTFKWTL